MQYFWNNLINSLRNARDDIIHVDITHNDIIRVVMKPVPREYNVMYFYNELRTLYCYYKNQFQSQLIVTVQDLRKFVITDEFILNFYQAVEHNNRVIMRSRYMALRNIKMN